MNLHVNITTTIAIVVSFSIEGGVREKASHYLHRHLCRTLEWHISAAAAAAAVTFLLSMLRLPLPTIL